MAVYKITNITNLFGRRDINYNTVVDITYVDSMTVKHIKISPSETIYLKISSIPLSARTLNVKKMITILEVSENEMRTMFAEKNKATIIPVESLNDEITDEPPVIEKKNKK